MCIVVVPRIMKTAQITMNIPNCIAKEIRLEIDVAIGVTNLGKYTFPMIPLFPMNVFDVALTVDEK